MKIMVECAYKGSRYYGWQKQVSFITVQEIIEAALSKIYDETIDIVASGRTDAGVHALKQVFHYVSNKEKDLKQLTYSLNAILPEDIKILTMQEVDESFHARYQVKRKIYEYRILLDNKDPFAYEYYYVYPMAFDYLKFEKAIHLFIGKHNFQDFTSKEEDENTFVREIYDIRIAKEGNKITVVFEGNGFMRYQIRNMIGSALAVSKGKENIDFIKRHLVNNKQREIISYKAPACGLYLLDVKY